MAVKAPTKLGAKARRLWNDITDYYDLRPDELRILEDACREVDLVERLESAMSKEELVVRGSMGQPVANGLLGELRAHRSILKGLLAQLKLPDEPGAGRISASTQARNAAQARWAGGS